MNNPENNKTFTVLGTLLFIFIVFVFSLSFIINNSDMGDQDINSILNIKIPYSVPKIEGIEYWINSEPIDIESLKGDVVLIDFWTYSCINCIRNSPFIIEWHKKYANHGLKIIGIHTPEFEFEKDNDNVVAAVRDFGIPYPVAQDNNYITWKNFDNLYWPALYLIDKEGKVRYTHFGEGEYDATEKVIRFLLGLDNDEVQNNDYKPPINSNQTPELYLGYTRSGEHFLNTDQLSENITVNYTQKNSIPSNSWTINGFWEVTEENLTSKEQDTSLTLKFSSKEVYLVMGATRPSEVKIKIDDQLDGVGSDVDKNGIIHVDGYKLYRVVKFEQFKKDSIIELTFPPDVQLHAFTFGS